MKVQSEVKMVIRLVIIVIFVLSSLHAYSQGAREFEISPRVGSEIDINEKGYFNLFPMVNSFKKAVFYEKSITDRFVVISSDSAGIERTDTLVVSDKAQKNLGIMFDYYEHLYVDDKPNEIIGIEWESIIRTFVFPAIRYDAGSGEIISFRDTDSNLIEGRIIYSDSSYFMLCPVDYLFDWQTDERIYRVFHYSDINELIKPKHFFIRSRESVFRKNLDIFFNDICFARYFNNKPIPPAPEITRKMEKAKKVITIKPPRKVIDFEDNIDKYMTLLGFHIYAGISAYRIYGQENTITYNRNKWKYNDEGKIIWYPISSVEKKYPSLENIVANAGLEYSISNFLRLTIDINYYITNSINRNTTGLKSVGYCPSANIKYVYKNYDSTLNSIWNSLEMAVSLGINYNYFESELYIYQTEFGFTFNTGNLPLKFTYDNITPIVSLDFDYYFSYYFSVDLGLYANIRPVSENIVIGDRVFNKENYNIKLGKVDFTDYGINLGLGYHL
jgi:hypothetical protein